MTLDEVTQNKVVKIIKLLSGRQLRNRLMSMGILLGSKVRVVKSSRKSSVTIKVKDSTITIGHGMASKIIVNEV